MVVNWGEVAVLSFVDLVLVFLLAKLFFKKSWGVSLGFSLLFVLTNAAVNFAITQLLILTKTATFLTLNTLNPISSFIIIYLFVRYVEKFFVEKTFFKSLYFFITYLVLNLIWKVSLFVVVLRYLTQGGLT